MASAAYGRASPPPPQNGGISTPGLLNSSSYSKSLYTSPSIMFLDVGPKPTRFRVHSAVVSKCPSLTSTFDFPTWITSAVSKEMTIPLPDLDEDTAHTLIHFLYTGSYQVLHKYSKSQSDKKKAYKSSVLVYTAAVRYAIPSLASEARNKVLYLGTFVDILDILSIARDFAFPNLNRENEWFAEYITQVVTKAGEVDSHLFTEERFSNEIEGDKRFRHTVLKAVIAYQSRVDAGEEVQDVGSEVQDVDELVEYGFNEEPVAEVVQKIPVAIEEPLQFEAVVEEPQAPEDDWGFSRPADRKKKGNKGKRPEYEEPPPPPAPELPPEPEPEPPEPIHEEVVPADEPWEPQYSFGKKKKTKKSAVYVEVPVPEASVEELLQHEAVPEVAQDADGWGSFATTTAKKKKGKKGSALPSWPPEPEAQPQPEPEIVKHGGW